ncbi:MAG: sporulation protein YqfD [Lachnospiraceae bacterium]|nr:sporulation protein YqfD [Lachnospiraceae bacterium]
MVRVIRYLKGYVSIKVWGFSPERFMNLCSNHNIFLWDIVNCGEYYTMNISLKGFYQLRAISRKTGTRVVITRRYGLPFLSVKMWKRKIFLIGLLGSLIFWIWMSRFIWAVEIEGNYYVSEDVFLDFLKENGIEAGIKKNTVSMEELERAIRKEYDIVTWTSAQIDGTRLLIQIKENDLSMHTTEKAAEQQGEGMDLVAEKDGVILSIVTRAGVPLVKEGAEVNAGDVLVEGGVPILNEDGTVKRYDFCVADADIRLQCIYSYEEKEKETYIQKVYTGRETKSRFIMFGTRKLQLPKWGNKYEKYDVVEEKTQLCLFENYYLPVYIGSVLSREYVEEEKIYSKEEIKTIFEGKIQKFIQSLDEKGVQIIEKNVTINKTSGVWRMKVDFLAVEMTGRLAKTHLEQVIQPAEADSEETTE